MGIYTVLFVPCPHCKQAVWQILPAAPGLVPGFLISRSLFHWDSQWALWITTGVCEILTVVGLIQLVRRNRTWAVATLILTLLVSSWFAVMVLALIRA